MCGNTWDTVLESTGVPTEAAGDLIQGLEGWPQPQLFMVTVVMTSMLLGHGRGWSYKFLFLLRNFNDVIVHKAICINLPFLVEIKALLLNCKLKHFNSFNDTLHSVLSHWDGKVVLTAELHIGGCQICNIFIMSFLGFGGSRQQYKLIQLLEKYYIII